jgi:D-threonine aldolase
MKLNLTVSYFPLSVWLSPGTSQTDHGNPTVDEATVLFCSDEHLTFVPRRRVRVGDRISVIPAHVDPTVAYHEYLHVADGEEVVDHWPVDMRGW